MEELRYMYLYTWSNINKMKETDWKSAHTSWFSVFMDKFSFYVSPQHTFLIYFLMLKRQWQFKQTKTSELASWKKED